MICDMKDMSLLKEAICLGLNQRFDEELLLNSEPATCSPSHYKKLSEILGISVERAEKKLLKKRSLIALLIAACIMLIGCTAYVFKNEIYCFIEEIHETFISLSFDKEQVDPPKYIEEIYELRYVPEGYKLIEATDFSSIYYVWENDIGGRISFDQFLPDSTNIFFDAEKGASEILEICGSKIYCRFYEDYFAYLWTDGKYGLYLDSNIKFDTAELKKIIENIKVK